MPLIDEQEFPNIKTLSPAGVIGWLIELREQLNKKGIPHIHGPDHKAEDVIYHLGVFDTVFSIPACKQCDMEMERAHQVLKESGLSLKNVIDRICGTKPFLVIFRSSDNTFGFHRIPDWHAPDNRGSKQVGFQDVDAAFLAGTDKDAEDNSNFVVDLTDWGARYEAMSNCDRYPLVLKRACGLSMPVLSGG